MDIQKVDIFMMTNSKYFEAHQLGFIREQLVNLEEHRWINIQSLTFTDPSTSLIVSIFAGNLGIDRFMIGDTGLGIAKLLTCGGIGIWTIIDWFMIMGLTREKNFEKLRFALA